MKRLLIAPALVVVLALAGCGADGSGNGDDGGDDTAGTSGDGMTLEITAPSDGDEVQVPFTVEFESSEDLGPTEDGVHHVHLFFDGDDSEYTVVESDSVEVTDLPEGEHVVNASLRNADHSAAGVETEITVTVGAGSGAEPTDTEPDDAASTNSGDGGTGY